jgi:hypothetical protein
MRKHVYFLPLAIGLGFTQASLASANGAIGEPGSTGPESTGSITGLNNVCVDLTGDDVVNGAVNVTIQSCDQQSDESWVFEPNGEIVGAGQKCLTVAGSGASGSNLVLEPCTAGSLGFHPANNQYWDWAANGTIKAVNLGLCLTIPNSNTANGTALQVSTCGSGANQQWTVHGATEMRTGDGECMDILNGSTSNGTVVQGAACNGGTNQKWTFTPSGMIRGLKGVCLDVSGGKPGTGKKLVVNSCSGAASQSWTASTLLPNPADFYNTNTSDCIVAPTSGSAQLTEGSCSTGNVTWTYASPLTVALHPQQQSNWCWDATSQMILDFMGEDGQGAQQCQLANTVTGRTDCCTSSTSAAGACNVSGWPKLREYSGSTTSVLSFSSLATELGSAPTAFGWAWTGGGGHILVAIGAKTVVDQNNNSVQYVTINDPWGPNVGDQADITYAAYVSSNGSDNAAGAGYAHQKDVYHVRKHGFAIKSDTNPSLWVNAWGGATQGTVLKLATGCSADNTDCTWSYQNGMIVSDTDPTLAINAYGGAANGVVLKLVRGCTPSLTDCTWTYKNGEFLSDTNPNLAINAYGGAVEETTLELESACSASNTDCTWTLPNVMLSAGNSGLGSVVNGVPQLAVNAYGGAQNGTALQLFDACALYTDCTWTFTKGMIESDTNSSLVLSGADAGNGNAVKLTNGCSPTNRACTFTWSHGELLTDNAPAGTTLPVNSYGGALIGAKLVFASACTASNPDCLFPGMFSGTGSPN